MKRYLQKQLVVVAVLVVGVAGFLSAVLSELFGCVEQALHEMAEEMFNELKKS